MSSCGHLSAGLSAQQPSSSSKVVDSKRRYRARGCAAHRPTNHSAAVSLGNVPTHCPAKRLPPYSPPIAPVHHRSSSSSSCWLRWLAVLGCLLALLLTGAWVASTVWWITARWKGEPEEVSAASAAAAAAIAVASSLLPLEGEPQSPRSPPLAVASLERAGKASRLNSHAAVAAGRERRHGQRPKPRADGGVSAGRYAQADFDLSPWAASQRQLRLRNLCEHRDPPAHKDDDFLAQPALSFINPQQEQNFSRRTLAEDYSSSTPPLSDQESMVEDAAPRNAARLATRAKRAEQTRRDYCDVHDLALNCSLSRRYKWHGQNSTRRPRAPVFIKTHKVGGTTFGSLLQSVATQMFLSEEDEAEAAELPPEVRDVAAANVFGLRECDFAKASRLGRSANCDWCCGQHQAKDILERCGLAGFKNLCVPDEHQIFITLLRNPLDRLLSMFFFHRDYKMDTYVRELSARLGSGKAFETWLASKMDNALKSQFGPPLHAVDHALVLPTFSNVYYHTCPGDVGSVSMLQAAQRTLSASVDLVGFQEHFDDLVILTSMALDWPLDAFAAANHVNQKGAKAIGGTEVGGSNGTVHLRANPHDAEVAAMDQVALLAVQAHPYFQDEVRFYEFAQALHRTQRKNILQRMAAHNAEKQSPRGENGDLGTKGQGERAFEAARKRYFAIVDGLVS